MNFNNLTVLEIEGMHVSEDAADMITLADYINGVHEPFHDTKLECVEAWATDNKIIDSDLIDSERSLSNRFDALLDELSETQHINWDDTIALSEFFNNWTDELTQDGLLHPEQYNAYCYIGNKF